MIASRAKLLTQDEVSQVHQASLRILADVGLEVNNERAREIYLKNGCQKGDEDNRILLPETVVNEFVAMTPSTFTYRARNPDYDVKVPNPVPLFMTASSAPYIIDPVTGEDRLSTSDDIARIAHLVNQLDGVDIFSVSVLADDAPFGHYSVSRLYTAMKYCQKPIRASGDPSNDSAQILKFLYELAGSEAAYKDHPFLTHHYCPIISPLKMDQDSTEMMIFFTEQGLPSHPTVVPNAGLTSPMSLAATLAQGNAEFLALASLMQMVRPQTETVYSSLSTVGDMRSGAYAPGGIECGMLNMAHAQMAGYYKVPCSGYVGLTNSKLVDAQAGLEKALSCMGGQLAGMDVLQVIGLVDALMAFDYGMALADNEMALMIKRMARGIELSPSEFALDEIKEMGPGGMFIASERTLAMMEDGAFMPQIADRQTRMAWNDAGSKSLADRALDRARLLLENDAPKLFSPDEDQRLRASFADLVTADLVVDEAWELPDDDL